MIESYRRSSVTSRRGTVVPSPRIKAETKDGKAIVSNDHADETTGHPLLMEAFGTASPDFTNGLISDLINIASAGRNVDLKATNYVLSIVKGIQPKDEVEAMLATQMAAVHLATITFARRLAHVENIPQQDSAERAFNKLARTFAAQVEALKRYRTGGQQSVTVRHVTIADGGHAIVGNVTHAGGRGVEKSGEQPHALGYAPGTEMPSPNPGGSTVPVASDAERPLPDARRAVARRPER